MAEMTPTEWAQLLDRYGVALVGLIVLAGAIAVMAASAAYGVRAVWKWATPRIDKVVEAHVTTVIGLTETQRHLGLKLDEHHDDEQPRLQRMETKLGDVHETVSETREHVLKLVRSVPGGS